MSAAKQKIYFLRIVIDVILVALSWILAYRLRFFAGMDTPFGIPPRILYFKLIPFIALIWFTTFTILGLYQRSGKHRSAFLEGLDILQCCMVATLAFIAFTYFYEEYRYSRIALLLFAGIHPFAIITGRSLLRKWLRLRAHSAPKRQALIIGSDEGLEQALHLVRLPTIDPTAVRGVILVGSEEQIAAGRAFCRAKGLEEFPFPQDWTQFFIQHPMHMVYLAIPQNAHQFFDQHAPQIADQVYDLKIIPAFHNLSRFMANIELNSGIPLISLQESPLEGFGSFVKRGMDILGSACGILVLSPIMAAVAVLVRLSSPGPVFYRQERMGLDGRSFQCLKFRSMPIDSEHKTGAVWATENDQRATPIGKMLRKTSMDELPQLFNVLRGDMSLVGPRPERPVFVNQFRKNVPGYMLRHKVKAGMTGWAQVNGWRGNTSIEKRIECDLYYIQNWSIWLDLKILLMTVQEVLGGKNAY